MTAPTFPIGALVLVDGRDRARVAQTFPQGSSSFMFPHYKVHFVGGDRNVAVALHRVSVVAAAAPKMIPGQTPYTRGQLAKLSDLLDGAVAATEAFSEDELEEHARKLRP